MEKELEEDLAEVLEGLDPAELLNQDPNLAEVALEVFQLSGTDGDILKPLKSQDIALPHVKSTLSCTLNAKPDKRQDAKASCRVCNNLTNSRYLNYGALTCNSCRAFFARSNKDNACDNYVCVNELGENGCQISSGSWRSCKKCRFKKCLEIGMRMAGKYRYGDEDVTARAIVADCIRNSPTMDRLTNEERAFIRCLAVKRVEFQIEQKVKLMMCDPDFFKLKLKQLYHGQAMTLKCFKTTEDFTVFGHLKAFPSGEFNMDGLTKKDRDRLFTRNIPLAMEFFEAYRISLSKMKKLGKAKQIIVERMQKEKDQKKRELYGNMVKEVTQDGKLPIKIFRYNQFLIHKTYIAIFIHSLSDFSAMTLLIVLKKWPSIPSRKLRNIEVL